MLKLSPTSMPHIIIQQTHNYNSTRAISHSAATPKLPNISKTQAALNRWRAIESV